MEFKLPPPHDFDINEIIQRCNNATCGPWTYDDGNLQVEVKGSRYVIADIKNTLEQRLNQWKEAGNPGMPPHYMYDGEFIANARLDIPKLIDIIYYVYNENLDLRSKVCNGIQSR